MSDHHDNNELPPTLPGPDAEPVGAKDRTPRIEGYQITGRLGEGGMGVVWRAVQLSTRREVALKLLTAGSFAGERARRRFEREVELAAALEHPNIARVYDSGLRRGVYYYAMELIEGVPLDAYVETNTFPQRDVLELAAKVARAVQHAHQRGVIHRDLKPSNILVTEDAEPHVLDFGLAKMLLAEGDQLEVSHDGDVVGTPAYMSPEQAAGHHVSADTRSDVYSLGVILYRLLTGESSHDLTGTRYEVLRRIAEEEVRRPREISRSIDRELEALLLKALAHDAERRYATAGDLAEDIDNYLAGDPLLARKPTTTYFLMKRLRKHWLPVSVGLLFVIVLMAKAPVMVGFAVLAVIAGIAGFAYVRILGEKRRAEEERNRAEDERKRADEERLKAEEERKRADAERLKAEKARDNAVASTTFLQEMLSFAAPEYSKGRDITVRELLDTAAGGIAAKFGAQPETEVAVRNAIGGTYVGLGLHADAEEQYANAWKLGKDTLGEDSPYTLAAMEGMGHVLFKEGRLPEAERLLTENVRVRKRVLGEKHPDTLRSASTLAFALLMQHKVPEALELHETTLAARREVLGAEHEDTLDSLEGVALIVFQQGKLLEAERLNRELLELRQRVLGSEHPNTLDAMGDLARVLRDQGELAQAEKLYREALAVRRRVMGPEHPATLEEIIALSTTLRCRGEFADAETMLQDVWEISRRVLGEEHPRTLSPVPLIANVLCERGNHAAAEKLCREHTERFERVFGEATGNMLYLMEMLGECLAGQGRFDEAAQTLKEQNDGWIRLYGAAHRVTLSSTHRLVRVLREAGKIDEAETLARDALEAGERTFGSDMPPTLDAMNELALVLSARGKHVEAEKLCRETLAVRERQFGKEHPHTLKSMDDLSMVLSAAGNHPDAEKLSRETLDIRRRIWGDDHPWTRTTMKHLAQILDAQGKTQEAEEVREALNQVSADEDAK